MKKGTKIILLTAGICTVVGGTLAGIAAACGGTYQRETFERVTYSVENHFEQVLIQASDANVIILPSETGSCYVQCDETASIHYTVEVKNDKLYLEEHDNRTKSRFIGVMLEEREVVLYLPTQTAHDFALEAETASGNIRCESELPLFPVMSLQTTSGNVYLSSPVDDVSISTNSGNIHFTDNDCSRVKINACSGEVNLADITAHDLTVHTTSGDISAMRCGTQVDSTQGADPVEDRMAFQSTSGKIAVSVLSGMRFSAESSSGDIHCPPSGDADGELRAESTSGDISIMVIE